MLRFMFGRMPFRGIVWLAALAVGLGGLSSAEAQQREGTSRPPNAGGNASDKAGAKLERPAEDALRVDAPSEELLTLLQKWEAESAKIKKLQGEHLKWEYNYSFGNFVTRNAGVIYYEQPDKGRIDLSPVEIKLVKGKPPVERKKHWKTGEWIEFKVQPGTSERWYCDGQIVTSVDEKQKTATQYVIPPQNQGQNIIDGPLPFLFGMPAEKALRRYRMEIVSWQKNEETGKPERVTLQVHPKLRSDAANYQLATVILDLKTYLPTAVRMIDPAGTKETVYSFQSLKVNAKAGILPAFLGLNEKDPFKPILKGLKVTVMANVDERAEGATDKKKITQVAGTELEKAHLKSESVPRTPKVDPKLAGPTVPSVIGMDYVKAKRVLEQLDYEVALIKGSVAEQQEDINRIERQSPDPKTKLAPGERVKLWVFLKPAPSANE